MNLRKTILTSLLLLSAAVAHGQEGQASFTVAWWNVENFFDTRNDTITDDDDFTPDGEYHWTYRKFNAKRDGIYKTLLKMDFPDVVGLGEVENAYVLRELCQGTPLRKKHYAYVHYDSPDRRGIDCALLYRRDRFTVTSSRPISLSDSATSYFTRDILLVEGVTSSGDTLCFLVNHWPSKRGGDEAEEHRMLSAATVRRLMDSLATAHPTAAVIAMGDLNASADEAPLSEAMGFGDLCRNAEGIRNLDCDLPSDWGSHKYQGQWRYIDAMFLKADDRWQTYPLQLVRFDHLLTQEKNAAGVRPKRTHRGPRYEGGLSDHLPLLLKIYRTK